MGQEAKARAARRAEADTNNNNIEGIMALWPKCAEPVLHRAFHLSACINSVRVLVDVLSMFNIEARPATSAVMVMNPKMFQLARIKGGLPDTEEQFKAWVEAGAHNLAITGTPVSGSTPYEGWPWHLTARAGKFLIDPSARQFQRPQHGIDLPNTLITVVPDSWDKGERPHQAMTEAETAILYTAVPQVVSYEQANGWRRHPLNMDVVREVGHALTSEINRLKAN